MSVLDTRRFALLPVIMVALLTFSCPPYRKKIVLPPPPPDFCTDPSGPPWRPVICVDENNLTADPKVSVDMDVEPDDNNNPSNRPVVIYWRTHHRANLQLKFKDESCVETPNCNGQGHCSAQVKPLALNQKGKKIVRRCTYEMLNGDKKDDEADIVITPCCW